MRTSVTSLRLDPGAAEVLIVPHWTLRALAAITGGRVGRRSYMRRAVPVAPGMLTWRFDDGRCEVVDDETLKAIQGAVAAELSFRAAVRQWMDAFNKLRNRDVDDVRVN